MAKQKISELAAAATLTGAEVVIVNQSDVTKKSTVTDVQAIPLAAAVAAQTTADTAQTTADAKLATVAVDGTTITGDGTVGNPLELVTIPPKEYRGYLTIGAGGVTFASKQNDVGEIAWTEVNNGILNGVLAGAFLNDNFFGIVGNMNSGNAPYINILRRTNDNTLVIDIFKYDGSRTGTPYGSFPIHLIINN
jgi:hypothetical protein